jgi:peptidoglycan/xylan/chitin deacetylase (PgdA/CDA1 family)
MKKKISYLTIDDAPSKDMKEKVDYLFEKNIPAIWFCRGNFLEERKEDAIYAIGKRYVIGNHSYSHPYFSNLTLEQCFEEIEKTDKIINEIYNKAETRRPAKFFRFPYGDKGGLKGVNVFEPYEGEGKIRKEKIQEFLKELGYSQPEFKGISYKNYRKVGLLDDVDWHWTYDVEEYHLPLDEVLSKMDEDAPEKGRGLNSLDSEEIILIHDHEKTAKFFRPIIERLLQKGIIFRAVLR